MVPLSWGVFFVVGLCVVVGLRMIFRALTPQSHDASQKKCPACRHAVAERAKFCAHCGSEIT